MSSSAFRFDLLHEDTHCGARLSRFTTPHGPVDMPAFMPVGTQGTVKGVDAGRLRETGAEMILANTYHLLLRPGAETVAVLGGLHTMMGWDGPILTDSGGFQIFSLAERATIDEHGAVFRSHIDGATVELTPEQAIAIQEKLGSDVAWDQAERALEAALKRRGTTYGIDHAGGAFYGPKIDVKVHDAIGREWQGATLQLDFQLPERFQLEYAGADNRPHRPVMIHRAIYGTLERFLGFLIEHFAGAFPLWLSPEQVRVLPISDAQLDAARAVHARLRAAGIRSHVDERSDTLNYKIRDAETQKVPYMAVVGQREAEAGSVAVRVRGAGKKQEILPLAAFVARLEEEIRSRALAPLI